jgi:hypothetical protein
VRRANGTPSPANLRTIRRSLLTGVYEVAEGTSEPFEKCVLALAPSFLRAIYSIPSFGKREIRRQRLPPRYQQKYQQNDRLQRALRELLLTFSNTPPKFY